MSELIRKKPTLTTLYLNDNGIGNQGVTYLADALCQSKANLRKLYLQNNKRITNESMSILIEMFEKNQSLTTFWLTSCNITEDGRQRLQKETSSKNNFIF